MKIISTRFFKIREPKKFRYIPRYYDERKEKFNQVYKQYEEDESLSSDEKEEIKRELILRSKIAAARTNKNESLEDFKAKNLRLLIVLGCVLLLTYIGMKRYGLWDLFF